MTFCYYQRVVFKIYNALVFSFNSKKKEKMETIKNGGEEGRANKSRGIRNFLRKVIILFHSYNTFFV